MLEKIFHFERFCDQVPFLDLSYVKHRYLEHPIYKYELYGAFSNEAECSALFIFRRAEHMGHSAYRLVRFIGDQKVFLYSYYFLNHFLDDKTIEYIDFYCAGFERDHLLQAGFELLMENDTNIIPNYFEPFVQENIDIFCDSTYEHTFFCKGDADQDRPNFIPDGYE